MLRRLMSLVIAAPLAYFSAFAILGESPLSLVTYLLPQGSGGPMISVPAPDGPMTAAPLPDGVAPRPQFITPPASPDVADAKPDEAAPRVALPTIVTEDGPLRALESQSEILPFAAIGRLDTPNSFCSATLIAPDLVLTAAHCLFDPDTKALRPNSEYSFQAGLSHGRAAAVRAVTASFADPGYDPLEDTGPENLRADLALLRLDRPIVGGSVLPLQIGAEAGRGTAVTIVSYGRDRQDFPSIEEGCDVLDVDDGVQILNCSVVPGSSGSPVLVRHNGVYRVAGVISALVEGDEPIALSASLDGAIDALLTQAGGQVPRLSMEEDTSGDRPVVWSLTQQSPPSGGGARFVPAQ